MAEAPHVGAAPLPALPAVRVVLAVGVTDQVHEAVVGAEAVADVAPQVVRAGGREHARRTDLALDAHDLGGHDVEGLVPADGLVAGLAALVRVARPVGVEVDPLEGREDARGRVDGGAVRHGPRGERGLARGRERAPARLDLPRGRIVVVELQRDDALDASAGHVDVDGAAGGEAGQSPDGLRGVHARVTVRVGWMQSESTGTGGPLHGTERSPSLGRAARAGPCQGCDRGREEAGPRRLRRRRRGPAGGQP